MHLCLFSECSLVPSVTCCSPWWCLTLEEHFLEMAWVTCTVSVCLSKLLFSAYIGVGAEPPTLSVLPWPRLSGFFFFFALLQVVVFEEQETDGKIEFTSSPDYGMPVNVQWGREMRRGGWWESSWGGHDCFPCELLRHRRKASANITFFVTIAAELQTSF